MRAWWSNSTLIGPVLELAAFKMLGQLKGGGLAGILDVLSRDRPARETPRLQLVPPCLRGKD